MTDRIQNKILQVETTVEGILDRIIKIERALEDFEKSRRFMYVDEELALVSSEDSDAEYLEWKKENELPRLQH